ncbi:hypothetical protein [Jiangella sp. DSM 45060]|uniref:hypothetical protein n=1 Tax=Jiangella sp. DSM 45060 TaxID=1798224 RepID=UPI00087D91AA|nr:hypothetical protein [Jiangella sp. DSM 45060]SDS07743.1 hypothetical protein SAMN04515669_0278 [Jiangella sp. DSM 45060]
MLHRDTEYVLTWNAVDHAWEARPIRREGRRIVPLAPDGATGRLPAVFPDAAGD